jgi:hypothetical protein
MGSLRVEVTAEDIAVGRPGKCCYCPVALAISRACGPGFIGVSSKNVGFLFHRARPKFVPLPEVARRFICDFDSGRAVAPFAFDLDVPEGVPA